jgi:hypothetical protein
MRLCKQSRRYRDNMKFYCFFQILLVLLCIFVYLVVCFICFYLILYIIYSYCYVYVFLLLCMFRSRYCVLLCCSVYCLCVNVYCTTATGCQPKCSIQIYHITSFNLLECLHKCMKNITYKVACTIVFLKIKIRCWKNVEDKNN